MIQNTNRLLVSFPDRIFSCIVWGRDYISQIAFSLHAHTHMHMHTMHTRTHAHTHTCTLTHTRSCMITGLAGSNDIENAQIWGLVDETTDLLEKAFKSFFEKDEAKKV